MPFALCPSEEAFLVLESVRPASWGLAGTLPAYSEAAQASLPPKIIKTQAKNKLGVVAAWST